MMRWTTRRGQAALRLLLPALLLTACAAPAAEGIAVHAASPPVIDGTLSPGEWDRAHVEHFADGSELLLMHADGALYLGIRSVTEEMIVANVFLDLGEEIAILHTSAALGTARYAQSADAWHLMQDFDWCCRSTLETPAAQAARDAFLQSDGWTSVNTRVGAPNEVEFRIEIPANTTIRLAVNILRSSNPDEKVPWPAYLADACILPTPGGLPESLQFTPETWTPITLAE
ncbi:MAG: hypothetical protein JXA97_11150 [Anaerolineales bacterium]|nr:hypothetical protein [Anaerolineales bacterium]